MGPELQVSSQLPFRRSQGQDCASAASAARRNIIIEAWLHDLVSSPSTDPPSPSPCASPSGREKKKPECWPVLGEMDRNMRRMRSAKAVMEEGAGAGAENREAGDEGGQRARAGRARGLDTPSSSPTKKRAAAAGRRKGQGQGQGHGQGKTGTGTQREDSGKCSTMS